LKEVISSEETINRQEAKVDHAGHCTPLNPT
jgi:hypothetical protein